MPAPYDYTLGNVPNPADSFMQGLQRGVGIQQLDVQRQQQQLAMQAAQQKLEAENRRVKAMQTLHSNPNPTAEDYRKAMIDAPDLSEHLKRGWEVLNTEQQQSALNDAGQVYAALESGKPEYAIKSLRDRVAAMKTGGANPTQIKAVEDMASLIEMDPNTAKRSIGMRLATAPGGDKVMSALATLGGEQRNTAEAPAKLAKAEADAKTAGVTAKFAESQAVADLEKKGWDVKAIQADIGFKKESNRIAAMNAAAAQMNARSAGEGNDLKRQELKLKIDDAVRARDDKVREKVAQAETGAANIDNMLNTVQRVLKAPGLREVIGSIEGADYYPTQTSAALNLANPFTSSGDDRADAIALIETLGSQAFLSQLPSIKGMGQLSNSEGDKLQASLQNLSRKQSEKQFTASLNEATRLLTKARENISKSTGVPLGKPDTPAAPGARPPLSSFNKP